MLGVVPQEIALYEDLTARENLSFWGKMYGLRGMKLKKRLKSVAANFQLSLHADQAFQIRAFGKMQADRMIAAL